MTIHLYLTWLFPPADFKMSVFGTLHFHWDVSKWGLYFVHSPQEPIVLLECKDLCLLSILGKVKPLSLQILLFSFPLVYISVILIQYMLSLLSILISPSLSPPFLSLPPSHPLPPFLLLPSLPLFLYRPILWVFSSQVLRELMILSPLLFTRVLRAPRMLAVVLVAVLFTPR